MIDLEFYKKRARELDISQTELAKLCGCSPQQINRYWLGKSRLGSIMHQKLIKALSINFEFNCK